MPKARYDQQGIRNYLLKRLPHDDEELFETWLLETPSALEQVTLEQAMLKGASELEKSSSSDKVTVKNTTTTTWPHWLSTISVFPRHQGLIASAMALSLLAVSYFLFIPAPTINNASQIIYIEQLRSAQLPKVHIQSLDKTPNYQLLILLDDYQPPAFLISIFSKADNSLIFEKTIKPNTEGEIPIIINKALLEHSAYVLKVVPVTNPQSYQFLLEVQ